MMLLSEIYILHGYVNLHITVIKIILNLSRFSNICFFYFDNQNEKPSLSTDSK